MQTIYKSFKILNFESKHTRRRRPLYLCRRMPFWSWAAGTAGVVVQTSEATITGSRRNCWRASRFEDAGSSRSILSSFRREYFWQIWSELFFTRKCLCVSVADMQFMNQAPRIQHTRWHVLAWWVLILKSWRCSDKCLPLTNYITRGFTSHDHEAY